MGIPAYFSHIIKQHRNIIHNLNQLTNNHIDNLLMDCNSIIYDCVNNLIKNEHTQTDNIESQIIKDVCNKIKEYVKLLKPKNKIYIAFDGVAPVAKLEQQKTRRYKSIYQQSIEKELNPEYNSPKWSTLNITPGTQFMEKLSKCIIKTFNSKKYIVSTSDKCGEGEHKLFHDIRNNEHYKTETTVIYGLDADLIMLSLLHVKYCDKILLYRETPEFIKSIDSTLNPNELYGFNINELSSKICQELKSENNTFNSVRTSDDYVFICFLLGNDFIPHIPYLNIRTNGIVHLLDAYNSLFSTNKSKYIINENQKINWTSFKELVNHLSKHEVEYMEQEYEIRNDLKYQNISTPMEKFNLLPCFNRKDEIYIQPGQKYWKNRYYKVLFNKEYNEQNIKCICINYLEAIEWTFKYYNEGCPDWRWKYNYNYPPLMSDLLKYIPYFDTNFIKENTHKPVSQKVQLAYVLPKEYLDLLPQTDKKTLLEKVPQYYDNTFKFHWHFCKYFWESHLNTKPININKLEDILD